MADANTSAWKPVDESAWKPVAEAAPAAPRPHANQDMGTPNPATKQPHYIDESPMFKPMEGFGRIGRGITGQDPSGMLRPSSGSPASRVSDVIEGVGEASLPFTPMAAPRALIGGLVGGGIAGKGTEMGAEAMGETPENAHAMGNLASIPGAILGGGAASAIPSLRGMATKAAGAVPSLARHVPVIGRPLGIAMDLADAFSEPLRPPMPSAPAPPSAPAAAPTPVPTAPTPVPTPAERPLPITPGGPLRPPLAQSAAPTPEPVAPFQPPTGTRWGTMTPERIQQGLDAMKARRRGAPEAVPRETPQEPIAAPKPNVDELIGKVRSQMEENGMAPKGYKWDRKIAQRYDSGSAAPVIDMKAVPRLADYFKSTGVSPDDVAGYSKGILWKAAKQAGIRNSSLNDLTTRAGRSRVVATMKGK